MFSGTDFQVNNSIFYNVNGDINLQTHHHRHLEIQHLHAPAPLRLNGGAGSQQHLAIEDRHAGLWPDVDSGGAQPASGPTRNIRHHTGTATRMQAPYDGSLRPRHAVISSNEGPSSFGAVMAPGGWPGSHSTPELVYPPPSDHFHSPPHPQYFYPHDTDNSQSGRESNYPHPDYEAAQNIPVSSNERGYSTPYLNSPNPPPFFQGGTYITAQNVHQGYTGMHILHRSVTLEALYDSADSFPQPRCHPETRTEMLAELYNWLTGNNTAQSIWWLYGPAGAGKSAIMQTLCRQLKDTGRLGGTFFFKRGHPTRGNAKALFTTLAYQLAENNDHLKPMISQTVEHYSSIVGREMEVQLHHLIVEPCRLLTNSLPSVLLIDGLDECQDESVQCEILRLIGNAVHQNPGGLRFLIASRPEAAISETVKDPVFDGLLTHLNVEQSFHDVRTYLQDEFARIHREHHHTMHTVPTPWPSPDNLDSLVKKSSGYFVYASTVIKFVDDKSFRPTERLNAVQNLQCDPNSDTPFTVLDQLYIHILSSVPLQFRSRLLDILQCVTMGFRFTLDRIDRLFEWHPGDSQLILRRLPSLLKIPSYKWRHIFALHASLLDFLQDEGRSAMFHLNLERRMIPIRAVFKAFSYENGQHKSIRMTLRMSTDALI
ncbi:hypothetical protein B0H16DRAFT_283506 [Mycena metata]|uniref:Nephrocystin 3-like N-terminal domain-containing protein n=1 Tax=Mycena metata TaxID=1033252 RepID=A0AAD7MPL9_9AGAR|nr:hypothetical protein B0H16DRAFT_283506 [Mycena metata]